MAKFKCDGCDKIVVVNTKIPKQRRFVWTHRVTKKRESFCWDCDAKLIQDVPLPNDSRGKQ